MSDLKKKLDKGVAYLKRNGIRQTLIRAGRKAALSRPVDYEKWLKSHSADRRELERQRAAELWKRVPVSAVLLYGTAQEEQQSRESLMQQTFGEISVYTQDTWNAQDIQKCEYILLIQAGAVLRPEAVYRLVTVASEKQKKSLLYTDHDILEKNGHLKDPFCKPDYDPVLQSQMNYLGPVLLADTELVKDLTQEEQEEVWRKLAAKAEQICHVPELLYHISEKMDQELESPVWIQTEKEMVRTEPLVSVIIPNKDHMDDLICCIDSVLKSGGYEHLEILIVENNSTQPETFREYERLMEKDRRIRLITWKGMFNYSRINNDAAMEAKGDYLLFLNNDTKIKKVGAIKELVQCICTTAAGAVGCRLIYGDGTIQHAGVVLGYGGVAGHAFEGIAECDYACQRYARMIRQMSAVTAACMLVSREAFWQIGGFTEELGVAYNDIDFCMKLQKQGYMVLYDPKAELYHYESQTRGFEMTAQKAERVKREADLFCRTWEKELNKGDRFYNPNLTLEKSDFSLKR